MLVRILIELVPSSQQIACAFSTFALLISSKKYDKIHLERARGKDKIDNTRVDWETISNSKHTQKTVTVGGCWVANLADFAEKRKFSMKTSPGRRCLPEGQKRKLLSQQWHCLLL